MIFSLKKGASQRYTQTMRRKVMGKLETWKNASDRKPLLVRGARQVGKTWLMKEFGRTAYRNMVYIDFYNNERLQVFFKGDLDPRRIVEELGFVSGETIEPGNTLIIFDEIQECNRALNALKYFCDEAPEYHIMAAGSFLGISLHENESFPVGKTDAVNLYPLDFAEFLDAIGESRLNEITRRQDPRLWQHFSADFIKCLKYYFYTGGMPEVVSAFSIEKKFARAREIQRRIIADYEDDFSKHIGASAGIKASRIWNSIPAQLARENKKFLYTEASTGARSRDFRSPLYWLIKCGLVYDVHRISLPNYPLKSYEEPDHFKLYLLDVGLLSAMTGLDIDAFLEPDVELFNHFKGALAEQFVLQELKALESLPVFYWSREGAARAELDFVVQWKNKIIPLEVKAARNLKAKSLKVFIDAHQPEMAVRSSLADYGRSGVIHDIPLYLIGPLAARGFAELAGPDGQSRIIEQTP